MKFEHTGIKVTDMETSINFYTKILGCRIERDVMLGTTRLVFLEAHGTTIELIYKPENKILPAGPVEHMAFRVDNLQDEIRKLNDYGITEITTPIVFDDSDIIFFMGPNNERIEFAAYQN